MLSLCKESISQTSFSCIFKLNSLLYIVTVNLIPFTIKNDCRKLWDILLYIGGKLITSLS